MVLPHNVQLTKWEDEEVIDWFTSVGFFLVTDLDNVNSWRVTHQAMASGAIPLWPRWHPLLASSTDNTTTSVVASSATMGVVIPGALVYSSVEELVQLIVQHCDPIAHKPISEKIKRQSRLRFDTHQVFDKLQPLFSIKY